MEPKIRALLEKALFILEIQGCFLRDSQIGDCKVLGKEKPCVACKLIEELKTVLGKK